ncbi:MAG: hypothetical protein AMXMBFR4_16510 [Candidatus Hydrogenedentota bacterium]
MTYRHTTILASILLAGWALQEAEAQEPYPRIGEVGFNARLPFFTHDPTVPLEGRIVREWKEGDGFRQKFVFRGAQGFLVPGYVELPAKAPRPTPLVLLLHGWSGSKENWYEDDTYVYGGLMRKALLGKGFAIAAIDAAAHGERSNEIDYQHVNPFEDPSAPARKNYFTFAEIAIQTTKDYRRLLDYLAGRGDIDMDRVGIVGYSMGGMDSFYLMAVEPRIKTVVACVPPLAAESYDPASPIDYTWGVKGKPLLLIMGIQDDMYDRGKVDASYREYIESARSKLVWYDDGHRLSKKYVKEAAKWIVKSL